MKDLFPALDRWRRDGEVVALATLIRVRGSAPRIPGARLAATRDGRMVGSVSGGCVESDVLERARRVLDGADPEIASYGIGDEATLEIGLTCGGSVDVLIEPWTEADPSWESLRSEVEAERPVALAVGLEPAGLLGRRLVVTESGEPVGSVDPALDRAIAEAARGRLGTGGTHVLTLPRADGDATVFVESFAPAPRLIVVGATHIAETLCRLAAEVGFRVTIIDAREPFARAERFPDAAEVRVAWPQEALDADALDERAHVITLTHDAKFDIPALAIALRSRAGYVGALGSRRTHAKRVERLRDEGFDDEAIGRIRSPIGLDLGGHTPGEIAVSILSEMIAIRNGHDGRALVDGEGPIHPAGAPAGD